MSLGWVFLAAMVGVYGVANLLQSVAAGREATHDSLHPRLLLRLARQPAYVIGLLCQLLGFVLAFLARRDLPLFLVQSAVAAGLGITAVLGVAALKWRLPPVEIGLLALLGLGLTGLVVSAAPHPARQLGGFGVVLLVGVLGAIALAGFFAVRLRGAPGSVVLGALAGIAFGGAAVASRPLANISSPQDFVTDPLLYVLVTFSLVGQLLLGLAMQRGSTTAAVAAMDAAGAVPAAVIGLLFLGDRVAPGREVFAAAGFVITLGAVIGLTFFAKPQHQEAPAASATTRARRPTPIDAALNRATTATTATPRTAAPRPAGTAPAAATRAGTARAGTARAAAARTAAVQAAAAPATAVGTSAARVAARAAARAQTRSAKVNGGRGTGAGAATQPTTPRAANSTPPRGPSPSAATPAKDSNKINNSTSARSARVSGPNGTRPSAGSSPA